MGFPIISEIFDGLRWIIDFFAQKAPRPVQIVFFLLLLLGAVSMIPFMLHLSGFHCNNNAEPVKTPFYKIITNVRIAFTDAEEDYNITSYTPPTMTFVLIPHTACRLALCNVSGDLYYSSENECDNETLFYPYTTNGAEVFGGFVRPDWSSCITCTGTIKVLETELGERHTVCLGDAYAIPEEDMGFYQSLTCTPDESFNQNTIPDRCVPPYNYYYEYDTGTYDCTNPSVCGANITQPVRKIDELLESVDAKLLYQDGNDESIDRIVGLQCDKNLTPQIVVWKIPIFDYRLWILLIVIYVMFMFAFLVNRQR
jgi:hypothetical protein